MKNERILVGIASYRDPELLKTMHSCIRNAAHPENLMFAVVNQYDRGSAHVLDYFTHKKLKLTQLDYRMSRGVGFARRLMTDLWTDEQWALQIDAHTRFGKNWDTILIDQWHKCRDPKAILSTYLQAWEYREGGEEFCKPYQHPTFIEVKKQTDPVPVFEARTRVTAGDDPLPIIGASGGFQFGRGEIFGVPYVREVCFTGEEFVRAFQLYSHGFNFYVPRRLPVNHLYNRQDSRFWHDMPKDGAEEVYHGLSKQSRQFIADLLAGKLPNYSTYFGNARTLCEYSKLLNVDFNNLGKPPNPKQEFDSIFRENKWGAKESVSGPGSTLKATRQIARALPRLLRDYRIKTILDIPCGDFNWMRTVNLDNAKYIGADIVADLIARNRDQYPNVDFRVLDLAHDSLPKSDLVIVRDCLVHFPFELINTTIENIKRSGAKYLLVTTFPERQNYDITLGAWRPVDMQADPIKVDAEVLEIINEGCTEGNGAYADKSMILFRLQ